MDGTNASPIAFGTDGWRATLEEFTEPRVRMVAQAVATYLDDESIAGPVAVGYDPRESSRGFAEEVARVLAVNGRDVVLPERDVPTPVLAWTVARGEYAGGLAITASHNPPEYNGVKFVPADGAPALPPVTDAIEARLAEPETVDRGDFGVVTERDLVEPYLEWTASLVDGALEGLTVTYDAMHGSGRGVTDELLARAGADVQSLRCERDPDFGGGAPEPTADRVPALIERVTEGDADLGIVNDGDADRIGVVTPKRGFLDPNHFLATIYEFLLERRAGDVVRTVSTSSLVDRVAADHGHEVHETAVGFKWVARAMADHEALLGGEESGGFGLAGHLRNKDGVCFALIAAAAEYQQPVDARIDGLIATHGGVHQDRVSLDCPDERKEPVLEALAAELPETVAGVAVADVNDVDGFKILLGDGTWVLVRPSGTEPKLRIYAEARSEARVEDLLEAGRDLVESLI